MKRFWLTGLLLLWGVMTWAQQSYSAYYYQRVSLFEMLPVSPGDIVFLGNSITDGCEWNELLGRTDVRNRGISGDTSMGVYDRLGSIVQGHPAKVFLMIGINDLAAGIDLDVVELHVKMIVKRIKSDSPSTRLYLQSVLPVNTAFTAFPAHKARKTDVVELNRRYKALALRLGVTYIDLYTPMVDPDTQELDIRYINDGLHLLGAGYRRWAEVIRPYVNDSCNGCGQSD